MNNVCTGDLFQISNQVFWRCLLNGKMIQHVSFKAGDVCPICKRPIDPCHNSFVPRKVETRRMIQAKLGVMDLDGWYDVIESQNLQ